MIEYSFRKDHPDYRLAFHCAPALAGLKTANLISIETSESLERCGTHLQEQGIRMYPLLQDGTKALLLVYNEALLRRQLIRWRHRVFLTRFGYRPWMTPDQMLVHLAERIQNGGGEFPHEIGVFLGYPLTDIMGFIMHRGASCKLCGYWKVYGNEEKAKYLFAAYDAARDFYCSRVLRGDTIHTIQYGGYCT